MKAVCYSKSGSVEVLQYIESYPKPIRRKNQVIVRVAASSVNPVDWKIRLISIPSQPKNFIPGSDFSGVVEECDTNSQFKKGDKVYGLLPILEAEGGCAEYVAVKESHLALCPKNCSLVEASALPLVALTVFQSYKKAGIITNTPAHNKGKTILVHAGAGGVGSMAIQLAKSFGLTVYTTCSERNIDFCKNLGASYPIDYNKNQFENIAKNMDYILDVMGGDYELRSMKCIKSSGVYMNIMNSGWATKFSTGKTDGVSGVDSRLGSFVGMSYATYRIAVQFLVGPYYKFCIVKPDGASLSKITSLVEKGDIKVYIDKIFKLQDTSKAHKYMEIGHTRGKVVVIVDENESNNVQSQSKL